MTISGVATVWLPVHDMDRALDFYTGTLGLTEKMRDGDHWAEVEANKLTIGLNAREEVGSGSGGAVVTFQPDGGLDSTVEELKGQGVEFPGEISDHDWGRIATFRDSEGNDLQLYEPPKG